jgi:outer membrane protein assembly factor BamB
MRFQAGVMVAVAGVWCVFACPVLFAADQPQWGQGHTRNMVSSETGLPDTFDPSSKNDVKWTARLGSVTYGTPVLAGGRVYVGTNNRWARDPKHRGDRGILLCLDEATGGLLWQLVVPKRRRPAGMDCLGQGLFASPTVEGDRLYLVTNRGEVVCLDVDGMADGNDGPFLREVEYAAQAGLDMFGKPLSPAEVGPKDADIVWVYDMVGEVGVHPHDACSSCVVISGDFLYVGTSNGTSLDQKRVPAPHAPSVIALDKRTGRLAGRDAFGIGTAIFHGQWSSPALGEVGGRPTLFYGGGDGVCYAFPALAPGDYSSGPASLEAAWKAACEPATWTDQPARFMDRLDPQGPSAIISSPVFHEGRVYVAAGGDPWHGKRQSILQCLEAAASGNLAERGPVWSYRMDRSVVATPSVAGGLVYIADFGGRVHCLDARTGRPVWVHEERPSIWASTLVADGKVYVGTTRGVFLVLAAGREERLLGRAQLDGAIYTTPVAANGVLYVATSNTLYAVRKARR